MASTYTNDLRLELIATGEAAATWGDKTNVNLTNIASAFGYATQDGFAANADSTTTVADGVADPARAMYFKVTSSATLTATRTLTIAPDTISRLMWIENATTGGQSIAISQGTGANVTIPTGKTAVVYLDGAGSGASVVDAMAGVSSGASDTLAEILAAGNTTGGTDLAVSTGDDITFADNSKAIFGAGSDLEISSDGTTGQVTGNVNVTGSVTASSTLTAQKLVSTNGVLELDDNGSHNGVINSPASLFINIDSDGTNTGEDFVIGKDRTGTSGGTELFRVQEDGSVGIGTSSPSSYNSAGDDLVIASAGAGLTIASAANDSGHILFADSTTGTGAYTGFIRYDHTTDSMRFAVNAGVERLRIDASGVRVGTGGTVITGLTNGPNLVVGDAAGGEIVAYKNTNAIADGDFVGAFLFGNDDNSGTEDHFAGMWAKASGTQGSMNLHFAGGRSDYEAGTAHMTLDSIGNLGLGTSSPSDTYNYGRALDLQSSTGAAVYLRDSDNTSNFGFASYDGGENRCVIGGGGSAYLRFISAGAECGRFDASGNLFVGGVDAAYSGTKLVTGSYSSSTAGLSILANPTGSCYLLFGDGAGTAGYSGQINYENASDRMGFNTNNVERMVIDSNGYLLVSGNSLTANDHWHTKSGTCYSYRTSGNGRVHYQFYNASSLRGEITSSAGGATLFTSISDSRVKENITDAVDAGSTIDALQVRQFDMIGGAHHDYGMVAQELALVCPDSVYQPEDPEKMMSVDYSKLVPMLVKEIQSLRARVAQLES